MILTVEPGLMSAELGAVRNSDTVLITEDGFEFLTNSPGTRSSSKRLNLTGPPLLEAGRSLTQAHESAIKKEL